MPDPLQSYLIGRRAYDVAKKLAEIGVSNWADYYYPKPEKSLLQRTAEDLEYNSAWKESGVEPPLEEAMSPLDLVGPGALLKGRAAARTAYESAIGIERAGFKAGTEYIRLRNMPIMEWDVSPHMTQAIRRPAEDITVTAADVAADLNQYMTKNPHAVLRIHETPSGIHAFDMSRQMTPWRFYGGPMPTSTGAAQSYLPNRDILYDMYNLRRGGYGVRIGPKYTKEGVRAGDFVARTVGTIGRHVPGMIPEHVPIVNRLAMQRVERLIERGAQMGEEGAARIPGAAVANQMERQGMAMRSISRNPEGTGPMEQIVASSRRGRRVPGYGEYDREIMQNAATFDVAPHLITDTWTEAAQRAAGYIPSAQMSRGGGTASTNSAMVARLMSSLGLQAVPSSGTSATAATAGRAAQLQSYNRRFNDIVNEANAELSGKWDQWGFNLKLEYDQSGYGTINVFGRGTHPVRKTPIGQQGSWGYLGHVSLADRTDPGIWSTPHYGMTTAFPFGGVSNIPVPAGEAAFHPINDFAMWSRKTGGQVPSAGWNIYMSLNSAIKKVVPGARLGSGRTGLSDYSRGLWEKAVAMGIGWEDGPDIFYLKMLQAGLLGGLGTYAATRDSQ